VNGGGVEEKQLAGGSFSNHGRSLVGGRHSCWRPQKLAAHHRAHRGNLHLSERLSPKANVEEGEGETCSSMSAPPREARERLRLSDTF